MTLTELNSPACVASVAAEGTTALAVTIGPKAALGVLDWIEKFALHYRLNCGEIGGLVALAATLTRAHDPVHADSLYALMERHARFVGQVLPLPDRIMGDADRTAEFVGVLRKLIALMEQWNNV